MKQWVPKRDWNIQETMISEPHLLQRVNLYKNPNLELKYSFDH